MQAYDPSIMANLGKEALTYLKNAEVVGIGTGQTVNAFIDVLAASHLSFKALVSSSKASSKRLIEKGFSPVSLNEVSSIDVYIDGADEVDPFANCIKGGGGALTQEKCLAAASKTFVCIITENKKVDFLGQTHPLPIEVIQTARSFVARKLISLGGKPIYRENFITDNGHIILDVHDLDLSQPAKQSALLNAIPGVLTTGLFVEQKPQIVLCAHPQGVDVIPVDQS
jgi:ribose 5-phosphate isomerase A